MLPLALYLCAQLAPADVLHGVRRADGTLERLGTENDAERCWTLQRALVRESLAAHSHVFVSAGPEAKKDLCWGCRGATVQEAEVKFRDRALHGDPLGPALRDVIGEVEKEGKVCKYCVNALKAREEAFRRKLWDRLPELTGVKC